MATHSSSSFKQALSHPNQPLARLFARIEQQNQLLTRIKEVLPPQLAEHARHCVISEKKLLIYTDSAAWATQIRFYNKAILKAIEPVTRHRIEIFQIRIAEFNAPGPGKPKWTPKIPSPDKIDAIRNNATGDPNDPLNRALIKLSATLKRLSEGSPDSRK